MIVMTLTAMMLIMNDALTCAGGAVSFMTRGEAEVNFGQSGPGDLKHNDLHFHKNAIATANAPLLSVLLEYSNTDPYDTGVYSISRKIFPKRDNIQQADIIFVKTFTLADFAPIIFYPKARNSRHITFWDKTA